MRSTVARLSVAVLTATVGTQFLLACLTAGSPQESTCSAGVANHVVVTLPCYLVIIQQTITGSCDAIGPSYGAQTDSLQVEGNGDGGNCSVTLTFNGGVT